LIDCRPLDAGCDLSVLILTGGVSLFAAGSDVPVVTESRLSQTSANGSDTHRRAPSALALALADLLMRCRARAHKAEGVVSIAGGQILWRLGEADA